ncbi:hypothetical protein [Virgibacillus doumboii]|uniref:hypothetical protein n=1 Tax=Virgibacillus doumboii TaxID=2697503 RepID=UPI0013E063E3|nr:hypothetical protein [Virgibacillus doumboii]
MFMDIFNSGKKSRDEEAKISAQRAKISAEGAEHWQKERNIGRRSRTSAEEAEHRQKSETSV